MEPLSKLISHERIELARKLLECFEKKLPIEIPTFEHQYLELLEKDQEKAITCVKTMQYLCGGKGFYSIETAFTLHFTKKGASSKVPILKNETNKTHISSTNGKTTNNPPKTNAQKEIHVGRMLFVVGKIIDIKKHPDADSLYVETVDINQSKFLNVCSGLVNKIPIEELKEKIGIFCCNLKPVKMRGMLSEAMLMCASDGTSVELLQPPPNSKIGDRVICTAYNSEPDTILTPKEKVWETVQPDMKIDDLGRATYRNELLIIGQNGPVTAPSLKSCKIS